MTEEEDEEEEEEEEKDAEEVKGACCVVEGTLGGGLGATFLRFVSGLSGLQ